MKSDRLLLTVLAVALLMIPLSVFASGQQGGAADASMVITWHGDGGQEMGIETGEDTWATDEIEKLFNVDIQANMINTNDEEKVNLMLAAGEFPDTGALWGNMIDHYNEGYIRSIPVAMIRKYMPNYSKLMDEDYPDAWVRGRSPDNPDQLMSLQGFSSQNGCHGFFICFRTDWAENVGVTLPNYEQIKVQLDQYERAYYWPEKSASLDWYEGLLRAFRDKDPDGNGKNDTIPFGTYGRLRDSWAFSAIAGAYRHSLSGQRNEMVDGQLYTNEISPNFKAYLKRLAGWYEQNLMDQEFLTLDRSKYWDKIRAGIVGSGQAHIWYTGREDRMENPANSFASAADVAAGVEVVLFEPAGPDGFQGGGAYNAAPWYNMDQYIGAQVDDEKLAVILQIMDTLYYGTDEWWVQTRYGKAGVHFDWEGEPLKSTPIRRAEEDIPANVPKSGPFVTSYPPCADSARILFQNPPLMSKFYMENLLAPLGQARTLYPYRYDALNETGLAAMYTEHGEILNTLVDEFAAKAVVGEIDIDAEWDDYVRQYKQFGGDEILAEWKKAPIYAEYLKGNLVY